MWAIAILHYDRRNYDGASPVLGEDPSVQLVVTGIVVDGASSPVRLARFEREATTVAGLNHPNIVTLHSIEEIEGTRFLTMELVEGQNIAQIVTSGHLQARRPRDFGQPHSAEPLAASTCRLLAAFNRAVLASDERANLETFLL